MLVFRAILFCQIDAFSTQVLLHRFKHYKTDTHCTHTKNYNKHSIDHFQVKHQKYWNIDFVLEKRKFGDPICCTLYTISLSKIHFIYYLPGVSEWNRRFYITLNLLFPLSFRQSLLSHLKLLVIIKTPQVEIYGKILIIIVRNIIVDNCFLVKKCSWYEVLYWVQCLLIYTIQFVL